MLHWRDNSRCWGDVIHGSARRGERRSAWRWGALWVVLLCMGAPPAARAQNTPPGKPWETAPPYQPNSTSLTNPCTNTGAALTGAFATDPCALTQDKRNLNFARSFYGGEQLVKYLDRWWTEHFLPAWQAMERQMTGADLDQTRQAGTQMDAGSIADSAALHEKLKLDSRLQNMANAKVCVAGSFSSALTQSSVTAAGLTQGFKRDISIRPQSASVPPPKVGPALDMAARWQNYCSYFRDPDDNNGANVCDVSGPGSGPSSDKKVAADGKEDADADTKAEGAENIVDGDIDVEGFLLQDTIDFKNNANYMAAQTILQNLVGHRPNPSVPPSVVNTQAGKEWILRQQQVESARNIAADVIASMLARRAATKLPDTAGIDIGNGSLDGQCPGVKNIASFQMMRERDPSFMGLVRAVTCMEDGGAFTNSQHLGPWPNHRAIGFPVTNASNSAPSMNDGSCLGGFQFCPGGNLPQGCWEHDVNHLSLESQERGWSSECADPNSKVGIWAGRKIKTTNDFLKDPEAQIYAWVEFLQNKIGGFKKGEFPTLMGRKCPDGNTINASGILVALHLGNNREVRAYARDCTGNLYKNPDKNGTTTMDYFRMFSGFNVDPVMILAESEYVDPGNLAGSTGNKLARRIAEIRKKAGVLRTSIAGDEPSYNEVMEAMAKERFFDPDYYTYISEGKTSIEQERNAVNAQISITYQDIYEMQEKLNALDVAEKALKKISTPRSNQSSSTPLK